MDGGSIRYNGRLWLPYRIVLLAIFIALMFTAVNAQAQKSPPFPIPFLVESTEDVTITAPAMVLNPEIQRILKHQLQSSGGDAASADSVKISFSWPPGKPASNTKEVIGTVADFRRVGVGDTSFVEGKLDPPARGTFTITIHEGLAIANVDSDTGSLTFQPASAQGNGLTGTEDGDDTEREAAPIPALPDGSSSVGPSSSTPSAIKEDGSRIDVAIAYTQSTKNKVGARQIRLAAGNAEGNMNTALRNSLPGYVPLPQIRVVAVEEVPDNVPYSIGKMIKNATLSDLRRRYKADLVLVFHHYNPGYPGKAFIYCGHPIEGAKKAFGFVRADSINNIRMTPVHEMGHLFGAKHNVGWNKCGKDYHRGRSLLNMKAEDGRVRRYGTIMAYTPRRVRHFSNPGVEYRGIATGTPSRNNADAIRRTHKILANYIVNTDDSANASPDGPLIALSQPATNATLPSKSIIEVIARIEDHHGVSNVRIEWEKTGKNFQCPSSEQDWSCRIQGNTYVWKIQVGSPGLRKFRIHATNNSQITSSSTWININLTEQVEGPLVQVLHPAPDAISPANSHITVAARAADGDGVKKVMLMWPHTNSAFHCPGTNNKDWSCTQIGDFYTWRIYVRTGQRTFAVRAEDKMGNITYAPSQLIQLR